MSNATHQYAASNAFGAGPTPRGTDRLRTESFVLDISADNLGAGDLWKFCRFNDRTAIYEVRLEVDQLDTDGSATLTIDVGHDLETGTDDDDYFLANSTIGQAGGAESSTAVPLAPGEDFTLQAKVEAAAATAAAGRAVLTVVFGSIENA